MERMCARCDAEIGAFTLKSGEPICRVCWTQWQYVIVGLRAWKIWLAGKDLRWPAELLENERLEPRRVPAYLG